MKERGLRECIKRCVDDDFQNRMGTFLLELRHNTDKIGIAYCFFTVRELLAAATATAMPVRSFGPSGICLRKIIR